MRGVARNASDVPSGGSGVALLVVLGGVARPPARSESAANRLGWVGLAANRRRIGSGGWDSQRIGGESAAANRRRPRGDFDGAAIRREPGRSAGAAPMAAAEATGLWGLGAIGARCRPTLRVRLGDVDGHERWQRSTYRGGFGRRYLESIDAPRLHQRSARRWPPAFAVSRVQIRHKGSRRRDKSTGVTVQRRDESTGVTCRPPACRTVSPNRLDASRAYRMVWRERQ